MDKQLENIFNEIVSNERFTQDSLSLTQLDKSITETEEFSWYSKIKLAIDNKERLSSDEKIHFLAMHRTFLMLVKP